jgi:molybdopterin-containing oxidoreductase family membrane subunit
VLLLVIPLRRLLRLEDMITGRHFDVLCKLLLTSSLFLAYGYLMDVFTTYYGGDRAERVMFTERVFGYYWTVYWGTILFNVSLPQLMGFRRLRMNQIVVAAICLGVVVGMWLERYEIVVTSLHRPHLPSSWGIYHGTFWDWATLLGTVGMFLSGILLAVRYVPIIAMHEMRSLIGRSEARAAAAGRGR